MNNVYYIVYMQHYYVVHVVSVCTYLYVQVFRSVCAMKLGHGWRLPAPLTLFCAPFGCIVQDRLRQFVVTLCANLHVMNTAGTRASCECMGVFTGF